MMTQDRSDANENSQLALLTLSSFLFVLIYIIHAFKIFKIKRNRNITTSKLECLKEACLPEVLIELLFLILGWSLFFENYAISMLRCLRIFRYVWYGEYYVCDRKNPLQFYPTFYSHLLLQYLEKVGRELFTTATRGALAVMGIFLFVAFVFGLIFWQITQNWRLNSPEGGNSSLVSQCDSLKHCFLIMLRLTFYDGDGFDFIKSLMDANEDGLAFCLFIYMCATSLILINGLIGIFGTAFSSISIESLHNNSSNNNEDEDAEKGESLKNALERLELIISRLERSPETTNSSLLSSSDIVDVDI
jgi:hypothetical protein